MILKRIYLLLSFVLLIVFSTNAIEVNAMNTHVILLLNLGSLLFLDSLKSTPSIYSLPRQWCQFTIVEWESVILFIPKLVLIIAVFKVLQKELL